MELTDNQKSRIKNLEKIQISASFVGGIGGAIYAKKTGGGFWRYVGWWIAGSVALGLVSSLAVTPFKNRILKEGDANKGSGTGSSSAKNDSSKTIVKSISQVEADKILADINNFVKKQNEQSGGMTAFSNNIKNNMLKQLFDGGYKVVDNKAVKK